MVEGALAGIAVGALDGVMGCTVGAGVLMGMLGGGAVLGAARHMRVLRAVRARDEHTMRTSGAFITVAIVVIVFLASCSIKLVHQ